MAMKAYRHLSEKELIAIQNGDVNNIGGFFHMGSSNGHRYNANTRYLHFFRKREDIEFIQDIHRGYKNKFYICEFDIPLRYWFLRYSFGVYYARSGYELDSAGELCLPAKLLKKEWLKSVEEDNEHNKRLETMEM